MLSSPHIAQHAILNIWLYLHWCLHCQCATGCMSMPHVHAGLHVEMPSLDGVCFTPPICSVCGVCVTSRHSCRALRSSHTICSRLREIPVRWQVLNCMHRMYGVCSDPIPHGAPTQVIHSAITGTRPRVRLSVSRLRVHMYAVSSRLLGHQCIPSASLDHRVLHAACTVLGWSGLRSPRFEPRGRPYHQMITVKMLL